MTAGEVYIGINAEGKYQCQRLVNGKYVLWFGPGFDTPQAAREHRLVTLTTSPLRSQEAGSPVADSSPEAVVEPGSGDPSKASSSR